MSRTTARSLVALVSLLLVFSSIGQAPMVSAEDSVWKPLGPADLQVFRMAIDPVTPSTLYIEDWKQVYRSRDSGLTWTNVSDGVDVGPGGLTTLAIDPVSPSTLYTTGNSRLFKTTNGGDSWKVVNLGSELIRAASVAIDPLTPATVYVGAIWGDVYYPNIGGIYKSMNGGLTWIQYPEMVRAHFESLVIDPVTPSTLYGIVQNGVVIKSIDGGVTWPYAAVGMTFFTCLAIDPVTPATVYAGRSDGIYKSTDGGVQFSKPSTDLDNLQVTAVAIDPVTPATLYAGTQERGMYKSTDGGQHWSEFNDGLATVQARRILSLAVDATNPSTVYVGTYGAGVFVTGSADPPEAAFRTYLPLIVLGK